MECAVWKTVRVGNLGSYETARERLKDAGTKISPQGDEILKRATFENTEATLDLVHVLPRELGFETVTRTEKIVSEAQCHGLLLCPAEVAVQLWLQYPDHQPSGEWSAVAMDTIKGSGGDRFIFTLQNEIITPGCNLNALRCRPEDYWDSTYPRWVFVRN